MKRWMKNCIRVAFVCLGVFCTARVFFMLGYTSSAYGMRGYLLGLLYLCVVCVTIRCMFGLYDEAAKRLDKRKSKRY